MFIDLDNRGTGKTTSLIHDAYFTGLPIVVPTMQRAGHILQQAQQMGVDVRVYTINELQEKRGTDKEFRGQVLVDELQDTLETCLGVKVVKATMSKKGGV